MADSPHTPNDLEPQADPMQGDLPTRALPVLPLGSDVVLPGMVVTVTIDSDEARAALTALGEGRQILLVPRIDGRYVRVGVLAHIEDRGTLPNGSDALVVRAVQRTRLGVGVVGTGDALWLEHDPVDDPAVATDRAVELAKEYRAIARNLASKVGGRGIEVFLRDIDSPGALADTVGWVPDLGAEQKLELLETTDVEARIAKAAGWLKDLLAERELSDKIRSEVSDGMEKQQREFLLRQQLAAIRRELGESDDEDLVEQYRARIADRDLPTDVAVAVERELAKLERTPEQAAEHGWIRTWLDVVLELPWENTSEDLLDLARTREVLDADHTGLDEVKTRIVESLAVRKLRAERAADDHHGTEDGDPSDSRGGRSGTGGTILALVGPPGVGKTSLGESIARSLGRRFVRVALGGVRDEAEIRGHRRTYVGAQPGRIVRALTEAGTSNPVFLLDEIDKVGSDWRGDPSSALLEVLDPAQNHAFRDHYLEVDLDLSDVLFIATANVLDTIPGPLLDRMEVISVDGYTDDEKVAIARDHLLGRQIAANGLRDDEVTLDDAVLSTLVEDYTREAGVRNLERQLGKVLRKAATEIATRPSGGERTTRPSGGERTTRPSGGERSSDESVVPIDIDATRLRDALGRPRFVRDEASRTPTVGVVNGLAVTGAGGDVLLVEATSMAGEAGLTLTGQLGDVMSESGQIALSYIRSRADGLGIEPEALTRHLHVHFPAGAVPKDGPSAGVTMTTALVSLLTGAPVRSDVAMTGEISLQGNVLPIGGVKQKLLAAHRAGMTEVVIPARNEPDLDDVPDAVRDGLTIHLATTIDDVLPVALATAA